MKYTAIIGVQDKWWVGWIKEVSGVNCQEKTLEELIDTLRITLKEILEENKVYKEAMDSIIFDGCEYQEIAL